MSIRLGDCVTYREKKYALVMYWGELPIENRLCLRIAQDQLLREGETLPFDGKLLLGRDDFPIADSRYWTFEELLELTFTDGRLSAVADYSDLAASVRQRVETDPDFSERVWMRRDLPAELDGLWFS